MSSHQFEDSGGYRRVVLKLSGQAFGAGGSGLDPARFAEVAGQVALLRSMGIACAVTVGGGNLARGSELRSAGVSASYADTVGMLATGMNATVLAGAFADAGIPVRLWTRGPCAGLGRHWDLDGALHGEVEDHVVLLAGGLGVPGISTDVSAVRLAVEIAADAVILSKYGVDGVYTADPRADPDAVRLPELTASYALDHRLAFMDAQAIELARDAGVPLHVVPAESEDALCRIVKGEAIGSRVDPI